MDLNQTDVTDESTYGCQFVLASYPPVKAGSSLQAQIQRELLTLNKQRGESVGIAKLRSMCTYSSIVAVTSASSK